jgi:hypothetical protein
MGGGGGRTGGGRLDGGGRRFRLTTAPVLLIGLLAAAGCVSKSKARIEAQKAYIAGQQAAMERMQQSQAPTVTVTGPMRNSSVQWVEGMTLAKALAEADYTGRRDPSSIIVIHGGVGKRYDPKQVLNGFDVPLDAGDIVQLTP